MYGHLLPALYRKSPLLGGGDLCSGTGGFGSSQHCHLQQWLSSMGGLGAKEPGCPPRQVWRQFWALQGDVRLLLASSRVKDFFCLNFYLFILRDTETERAPMCWVTPQIPAVASGCSRCQELGMQSRFPTWIARSQVVKPSPLTPTVCISRKRESRAGAGTPTQTHHYETQVL